MLTENGPHVKRSENRCRDSEVINLVVHVINPTSEDQTELMIPRVLVSSRIQPTRSAARTATRLSYAKGTDTSPLSNETLPSFYEKELLTKFATRPALVSRHEPVGGSGCLRWSYGELWKQANDLARGLLGLGVTKGTRVGVVMGNNRYDTCGHRDTSSLIYAKYTPE